MKDYYSDWHGRDAGMLCYTSAPFVAARSFAGHPIVSLHLACDQPDAAVHVYLEEVERPVIAVPTSVGYGASLNGLAALLTMLNSCAPGVSVVNIDNGYGAAHQASQINHLVAKIR